MVWLKLENIAKNSLLSLLRCASWDFREAKVPYIDSILDSMSQDKVVPSIFDSR